MAIEFFATKREQLDWLRTVMSDPDVWCWIRMLRSGSKIVRSETEIMSVDFTSTDLLELDIGRSSVQEPVWGTSARNVVLDFPRSLAIQFDPCSIIDNRTLVKGQLAILSKAWYDYHGVDRELVASWYRNLSRLLRKIFDDKYMAVVELGDGRVISYRDVHLTSGAISWWSSGKDLKDQVGAKFKYELRPRIEKERPFDRRV